MQRKYKILNSRVIPGIRINMITGTIRHNRYVAETGENLSNLPDCSVAKGEGASK